MIGDPEPLLEARKINFVEGADWSEEVMGTNAIGNSIQEDCPLQVYAAEHFSQACHPWTCSAAPIHDGAGHIIGVLNMSGPFEKVHPHTLGMIVSAVKAIENQLQLQEKSRKNEMMKTYLEATTNTLNEGVLITNKEGVVIKGNVHLQQLLGLKEHQLEGCHLEHLFDKKTFQLMTKNNAKLQEVIDEEVTLTLKSTKRSVRVLLNVKPIQQSAGQLMGFLIAIKEIRKIRQFVNNMTGSRAKVTFDDIIGQSPKFVECLQEAKLAARSSSNVLLMGESGTGKDLFAQAIHNASEIGKRQKK